MIKPRVVLVDTDISYIVPLQQKFVEEYFEKIDLEVITDQRYYKQLFSVPQKVDVLVVAEELYTSTIQMHNIGNIFLMTEQVIEQSVNESNVTHIYKYTSIKEIFNVIVGKSTGYLKISNVVKKDTQIILVYSACGGVGKTTISLGISACLNKNYKKVLYMNATRLHSFQTMFSNKSPITSEETYVKLATETDNVYLNMQQAIRNEGFNYIPSFKAALMSLGIRYSIFENIAVDAKKSGDYDYIIIDADTVFDEDKVQLIDIADTVVIVTKQNKTSVYATNLLLSNINGVSNDKYIVICNDFDENNVNNLALSDINKPWFVVSDYVRHLSHYDQLKINDLANEKDIQKVTFLII